MATDPRDALNRLVAAFEHHFDVAQAGGLSDSRSLEDAEERLRDAFFTYDDELFTQYGIELPFDLVDDEDLDEDELEDEAAEGDEEDLEEDEEDTSDDEDDPEITDIDAD